MIAATGFERKNVAVPGLGKSGLATARSLEAGGAKVFAWDDAAAKREEAAKEGLTLADSRGCLWKHPSAVTSIPGSPLPHPKPHEAVMKAQAAGVELIGNIELI